MLSWSYIHISTNHPHHKANIQRSVDKQLVCRLISDITYISRRLLFLHLNFASGIESVGWFTAKHIDFPQEIDGILSLRN